MTNARLDSLYQPVLTEEALELDPRFDDGFLAMLDEEAVGAIMRGWRELVWRNAELLSLAKTPLAVSLAKSTIETYATTQAVLYRSLFASGRAGTAGRNAYCPARQG